MRSLLILVCMFAAPAFAQEIPLRSGDHPNFTRLTFPVPEAATWQVQQSGQRVQVRLASTDRAFNLSEAFARITRDRVSEVRADRSTLLIELGCQCDVISFQTGDRLAVIDVVDPLLSTEAVSRGGERQPLPALGFTNLDRLTQPELIDLWARAQVFSVSAPPAESVPRNEAPEPRAIEDPTNQLSPIDLTQLMLSERFGRRSLVTDIEATLVDELSAAVDLGLVAPSDDLARTVPADNRPEGAQDPALSRPLGLSNIAVRSPTNRTLEEGIGLSEVAVSGPRCVPDSAIALEQWTDGQGFEADMTRHRASLYGEFDRLNPEAAKALARAYLHFGFATEARALIEAADLNGADADVLRALAEVLEPSQTEQAPSFVGQESCPSDIAVWAVLAQTTPEVARASDALAVQRGFGRLPVHLQGFLGPKLVEAYTAIGDLTTADGLARALLRNPEESGGEASLGIAAIETAAPALIDLPDIRGEVLSSNAADAPKVLIEDVQRAWQQKTTVDPTLPDLLASYELEFRGSELARDLRRARFHSALLLAEFEAASELLPSEDERDLLSTLREDFFLILAERASDFDVLRYSLPLDDNSFAALSADTRNIVGDRLSKMGFPRSGWGPAQATDTKASAPDFVGSVQAAQTGTLTSENQPSIDRNPIPEVGSVALEAELPGSLAVARSLLDASARFRDDASQVLGSRIEGEVAQQLTEN